MLISPTEPAKLRKIGTTSSIPEKYGADILIPSEFNGLVGIQRKEFKDFVESCNDGRLKQQIEQMKQLDMNVLVLEGNPKWTENGSSLIISSWTMTRHLGALLQIQLSGCLMLPTLNLDETIELCLLLRDWANREKHQSLQGRPKPKTVRDIWGESNNREFGIHLLSSFPGIGAGMAGRIYDKFGGVPMRWVVEMEDMLQVDGIGKERVKRMWSGIDGGLNESDT